MAIDREATLDAESRTWLADLSGSSPERAAALGRLHRLLLRAARSEAARRAPLGRLRGPEVDDLAHQAADDALLAVLRRLPEFRGESRFTTWAYRFAALEVASKLERHFWNTGRGTALDTDEWARLPARGELAPESGIETAELMSAVRAAVVGDLTARQREVFLAVVVDGVPAGVLAQRLATDRGAVYKIVSDARHRIRRSLVSAGHLAGSGALLTSREPHAALG